MRRTASAASIVSGSASRAEGTNDNTIMSVSLSEKDVLHEFLGRQAIEVTARSRLAEPAPRFGDHLKTVRGGRF